MYELMFKKREDNKKIRCSKIHKFESECATIDYIIKISMNIF